MKNLCFLILLATSLCEAQVPTLPYKAFQNEFGEIAVSEMNARERFLAAAGDTFTVASDNFDVKFYRCEWQINPAVKYITGRVTAVFEIKNTTDTITFDLQRQLVVDSINYHGASISFQQTSNHGVIINFPGNISAGTKDSVTISYQGIPDGSGFGSFYQGTHAGTPVIWTLSEPYGSREWWPCKNGLGDKADSIDIIITTPSAYVASSNGAMVKDTVIGANRIVTYQHRYPIASYLVAVAATNYVISTDTVVLNGKPMLYKGYYYPESYADFKNYEQFSQDFLVLFSNLFGEYPFAKEKYAQTQFGWGGGMEHQTNSFIGNRAPNLQSHELMHQWFGDMVTCGSWQDLWLNEGFATYGTALTLEYLYPIYHMGYMAGALNSIVSANDGSVFVSDTTNLGRLFSSRLTYNKGCYVVHMLRWVLGDSTFYRGVRRYLSDPTVRFGYARTADLQRNLEQESGKNLNSFFQKWVYGEGHANYDADWTQNENNWVKVKLKQTTSHSSVNFYEMPVELLLRGATKDTSFIVDHRYTDQEFWLNAGFDIDTVIIDPDIWIIAKTKTSKEITGSTTINELKVFPNPAPDRLYLSLKNPSDKKLQLQLFNSLGQLVLSRQFETSGQDELINLPILHLARGAYWLKVRSEKNINTLFKVLH